jgi:hypothetical protein
MITLWSALTTGFPDKGGQGAQASVGAASIDAITMTATLCAQRFMAGTSICDEWHAGDCQFDPNRLEIFRDS